MDSAARVKALTLRAGRTLAAACLLIASPAAGGDLPFIGVNYGPFHRAGQSPGQATVVSAEQLSADLNLISEAGFRHVRTFGVDNGLETLAPLAQERFPHLRFFIGVYVCGLDHDQTTTPHSTRAQMNTAIRLANTCANVAGIVVGNECLPGEPEACPQPVSVDQLIADLRQVKDGLSGKARARVAVTTAMSMVAAASHHAALGRRVAEHCDVILVNIHPFFAPAAVEEAVGGSVDGSYRLLERLYAHAGKPIVIGETGWPSAGPPNGPAVPGSWQQHRFIRDVVRYASANGISVFLFEMFDEPWKTEAGGVGPHWGLFDGNGRPKFPLP
jgi:glucan 1,3-beta-glucosidase